MLEVKYSTRFKKDLKVCQKRHYDMNLLQQVINVLVGDEPCAHKDASLTELWSKEKTSVSGSATFSRIGC